MRGGKKNSYKIKNVSHNWRREVQCARIRALERASVTDGGRREGWGGGGGTSKAAVKIVQNKSGFRARRERNGDGGRAGEKKSAEKTGTRYRVGAIDAPVRPSVRV